MRIRARSILLPLLTLPLLSAAQTGEKPDTLQAPQDGELEKMLEEITQDAEDSQLLDRLLQLQEHPLDLNTASEEELQEIPGITPIMAFSIVSHRKRNPFKSVDDLLAVEGVTEDLFGRVRKFLRVSDARSSSDPSPVISISLRSRATSDLQIRRGFEDGSYAGSPAKLYNRLIARVRWVEEEVHKSSQASPMLEAGVLTKKDAGETSVADFVAGYVLYALPSWKTRVIVGDYIVESAEGLVLWRSIGFSKGSEVISTVRKSGSGLRPYLSTEENWFFRGVALEAGVGTAKILGFYSNKSLHASLADGRTVTSFYTSGLFRTRSEQAKRNSIRENVIGLRVHGTLFRGLMIGSTMYHATFDRPISLSGAFGFSGESSSVAGLDANYTSSKVHLFLEAARDHQKSGAGLAGISLRPKSGIEVAVLTRMYPRDFVNLRGLGFGESGGPPQNESGTYFAVKLRLVSWVTLSAYYDQFTFPWRTDFLKLPSQGNDMLVLLEAKLTRKLMLSLQLKEKEKSISENVVDEFGREARRVGRRRQRNYRATVELTSSRTFRWRSRVEAVEVSYELNSIQERGMLLFQDVQISPHPKFLLNARVIGFRTHSFDSRVYEFESDVRGTFSNPALFGKGIRWYVVGTYKISRSIQCWLKYAHTLKDGVKSLSSGSNQIMGNLESKINLQLEIGI